MNGPHNLSLAAVRTHIMRMLMRADRPAINSRRKNAVSMTSKIRILCVLERPMIAVAVRRAQWRDYLQREIDDTD